MVVNLRVDERLIHGQVVTSWLKSLNVSRIVVANDAAAKDEIQKMSLLMAVPAGQKCMVADMESAIKVLNDPRGESIRMLVVCDSPYDALELVKNVKGITEVNLVNYGSLVGSSSKRKQYAKGLFLDDNDMQCIQDLIAAGATVYNQSLPDNPKKKIV
ncbi:PTS sugar transporter subunit IIB [Eubacteriales bacterium OttesenSCG-928-N14]|nr:PTS sugar transporter subunit IIB [Eubacteriales bacterium OttesenSCG-928-N14]